MNLTETLEATLTFSLVKKPSEITFVSLTPGEDERNLLLAVGTGGSEVVIYRICDRVVTMIKEVRIEKPVGEVLKVGTWAHGEEADLAVAGRTGVIYLIEVV